MQSGFSGIIMLILFVAIMIGIYAYIKKHSTIVPSDESQSVINKIGEQASNHKAIAIILFLIIFIPGGFLATVLAVIALAIYDKIAIENYERRVEERAKYIKHFLPTNTNAFHNYSVEVSAEDANQLGANDITIWITLDDTHTVAFPESSYGYKKQYYLLGVHFQPKLNQEANQEKPSRTYKAFLSDYKTYAGPTDILNYEVPTNAMFVLTPTDLSRTIRIQLHNVKSSDVREIEKYALLGQVEKQKLGLK